MSVPSWHRYPGRYTIVFGVIALLLFVVEHINGRFWLNDFRVYYGAGEALLKGEPVYGVAHGLGTGVFKYAPLLAMVYAPFALLPYAVAASVQYLLIVLAFLDVSVRLDRLLREHFFNGKAASYLPLFLTGFIVVVHLHRELHLGNINMQLLWLLVLALERLLAGKDRAGGLLVGIAMLAKPHFVVLLPLLLLRGRWKASGIALGTVVLGVLLPALFLGFRGDLALHAEWLGQMARHNAALIYAGGEAHESVNTAYSFIHRAVLQHFMAPSSLEAYALLGLIATAFGLLVLWNMRQERRGAARSGFAFEFLLLVGLVPSITLTDTEHFLFAMPLVAYLVHQLVPRALPRWLPFAAVPVLFAYGGNWEDALGPLADHFTHYGVLGIGNVLLLVLCTLLFLRSNRGAAQVSNA